MTTKKPIAALFVCRQTDKPIIQLNFDGTVWSRLEKDATHEEFDVLSTFYRLLSNFQMKLLVEEEEEPAEDANPEPEL